MDSSMVACKNLRAWGVRSAITLHMQRVFRYWIGEVENISQIISHLVQDCKVKLSWQEKQSRLFANVLCSMLYVQNLMQFIAVQDGRLLITEQVK